jgi:hypothetical protein
LASSSSDRGRPKPSSASSWPSRTWATPWEASLRAGSPRAWPGPCP